MKHLPSLGPYIGFTGAVWNLHPVMQVLLTTCAFHYHFTDTQKQLTVAHHMAILHKPVRTLKEHYKHLSLSDGLVNTLSHNMLFPYCTEFKCLDDKSTKNIHYMVQLDEGWNKERACILWNTIRGRYSWDLHQICLMLLQGGSPALCKVGFCAQTMRIQRALWRLVYGSHG